MKMESNQAFKERCHAAYLEAKETVSGNSHAHISEAGKIVLMRAEYNRILARSEHGCSPSGIAEDLKRAVRCVRHWIATLDRAA